MSNLLLKKFFLVSRKKLREIETIDAKDFDVLLANFLLQVRKKTEQYEPTSLRSFVLSFADHFIMSFFKKERLFYKYHARKGVPKD